MSNIATIYHAQFGAIRQFTTNGKPWFNAVDVCNALGYKNSRKAILDNCRNETPYVTKRYTGVQTGIKADGTPAIQQVETTFIDEGNLYRLILRSKLPAARQFEDWVCDEVLPAIRKHGSYSTARFEPNDNQHLGLVFKDVAYSHLIKVDNSRVRKALYNAIEFYVSKIQ